MVEIANTESHTLAVDPGKNRIYCTVSGNSFAKDATFVKDWEKAKHLVAPGFTVLTDVSRLQYMTKEWVETSVKVQKMLIQAGLAGTAEILSESVVQTLQIRQINRIAGNRCDTKEELFTDRKIAEAWLDRISPRH